MKTNSCRVIFQSAVTNYRFDPSLKKYSITVIFVNSLKTFIRSLSQEHAWAHFCNHVMQDKWAERDLFWQLSYLMPWFHPSGNPSQKNLIEICPKLKSPWGIPRFTWLKLVLNVLEKHSGIETDSKNIHNNICELETLAANKTDWNNLTRGIMLFLTMNIKWWWSLLYYKCQMSQTSNSQRP